MRPVRIRHPGCAEKTADTKYGALAKNSFHGPAGSEREAIKASGAVQRS